MIAKKILGTVLAMSVVVSSVIGGGVGFANSSVVFAEEVDEQLSQGIYSVPIVRQFNSFDKSAQTYSSLHFLAQGILTVKDDGTQSLTIGVENWSLYDAFIPRKQGYFNEEYRFLPSSLFDADNTNSFTNFNYSDYENIIDNNNSVYYIGSSETKYGDISIDYETNKEIDVAYITFDLDDYKTAFSFTAWLNTPCLTHHPTVADESVTKPNKYKYNDSAYWADCTFHLNDVDIQKINFDDDSDLSYKNVLESNRNIPDTNQMLESRFFINYNGTPAAKNVFDGAVILKKDNGTFTVKYHINSNGFQYRPTRPVADT